MWAVGLESCVSPGLTPTAAPLLQPTLLDGAAGRLTASFVGRILTFATRRLTPDITTTSDLSATKAADQLSSRHVGVVGRWLLLQSSALTVEDGLDFLGGQSAEAQNAGGRQCTAPMSRWMFAPGAAAATSPPSGRCHDSSEETAACNMEQVSFFAAEMEPEQEVSVTCR